MKQERNKYVDTDYDSTADSRRGDKAVLITLPRDLFHDLGGIAVALDAPNLASVMRRALMNHVDDVMEALGGDTPSDQLPPAIARARAIIEQATPDSSEPFIEGAA